MTALGDLIAPCGPVIDEPAAGRLHDRLFEGVDGAGGAKRLALAWPALAPIFAASPYLAGVARRDPRRLARLLAGDPDAGLEAILKAAHALGEEAGGETVERGLRDLKAELHLLTAIADLGGAWDLDRVTSALSRFADAAVTVALASAAGEALAAGRMTRLGEGDVGPLPGLFIIAMGKHGAFELNYSSDIDLAVFYDAGVLPLAPGVEPASFAARVTERVATLLQTRTVEGYVFRVDLRLRPDPSSTPSAVSVAAALEYYESVGQNWERAALIKARAAAGDIPLGQRFLADLQPFIWRRNLDFAAIADIHSIKRQIHIHKVDDRLTAKGADLKLGRGGIREIEFYVQTQQLILGGRHGGLRSPRTLEALAALSRAGHVAPEAADELTDAYRRLRALEHRVQMVNDEHTHRLPPSDLDRRRIAALAGFGSLRAFDAGVSKVLRRVNRRYGELFAGEETLASRFGSLVFTGVEDDPQTLATLARMGFSNPTEISGVIRGWHHGHIAATRTERGREALTRLAPRLLETARATGAPDTAFSRFADFFGALRLGVQVQSLFLAQPRLFELVVRIMAFAPRFARTLARRPDALHALLDPRFFAPMNAPAGLSDLVAGAEDFEGAMDIARRLHREASFRIGVQVLGGVASAGDAGFAFAHLADGLIAGLARASLAEVERNFGAFPGEAAVIVLGKCGSREMTARSDLDLMTLYRPAEGNAVSTLKGVSAETFYARFTQRLVAALSAPTAEGGLYDVDLKLRPSGAKGPVAVSLTAFQTYYAEEAETWEFLAMTRARVVWATSDAFTRVAGGAIEAALRRSRDPAATAADVREMRALMARERPPSGAWDMKFIDGGLVDIEFCAQHLQLIHAADGGPLRPNTGEALEALAHARLAPLGPLAALRQAWELQQDLSQLLKVAVEDGADPALEPAALRALLARAGGARGFAALKSKLASARKAAHGAFRTLI